MKIFSKLKAVKPHKPDRCACEKCAAFREMMKQEFDKMNDPVLKSRGLLKKK